MKFLSQRARLSVASGLSVMFAVALVAVAPPASAATGKVMVNTQRMSKATLNSTQYGWYYKGSTLTLKCHVRGQYVSGYYGGPSNLWYKVSDGRYVADIDLNTGTNNPVAPACSTSSSTGNLRSPFAAGQTWYVCQGYNGSISHRGVPTLDLTKNPAGVGSSGCTGSVNYSANQSVYAPASGTLYQVSSSFGGVCINLSSGRSVYLGHLVQRRANGAVSAGTKIGVVAPAGQVNNGGYAHVHLQAHSGKGCGSSPKVPFSSSYSTKFVNSPNMTYSGAANQWKGTKIYR